MKNVLFIACFILGNASFALAESHNVENAGAPAPCALAAQKHCQDIGDTSAACGVGTPKTIADINKGNARTR